MSDDIGAIFPVRVLQVVAGAGYTTGVTPGAAIVPSGYTGPQIVFGAKGVGPVLLQAASGGGTASVTMSQAAEQQTGDLILIFVANHDSASAITASSSPGGSATSRAAASFSNGKFALLSLPYTAGDGPPIVVGANGSHLFSVWGCILRKPTATNATVDQNQNTLPNAGTVTNYSVVLNAAITATQANSCFLFYGNHYGAASSTAVNRWIPPGPYSTAYTAADDNDTWALSPVTLGPVYGDEFFLLASYRVAADKSPLPAIGYVGANGGASNQPFAAINFY